MKETKNIKEKTNSDMKYKGKVVLSILKGKKEVTKKTYTNEGEFPLFYCFALAASGQVEAAANYSPKYLKLFTLGAEGTKLSNIDLPPSFSNVNIESLSDIMYNTTPKVKYTDNKSTSERAVLDNATTTFKFLIPFTQIDDTSITNALALYSTEYKDCPNSPCAYIILTKTNEKGEELLNSLDTLVEENVSDTNNYNLYVQWTIQISN